MQAMPEKTGRERSKPESDQLLERARDTISIDLKEKKYTVKEAEYVLRLCHYAITTMTKKEILDFLNRPTDSNLIKNQLLYLGFSYARKKIVRSIIENRKKRETQGLTYKWVVLTNKLNNLADDILLDWGVMPGETHPFGRDFDVAVLKEALMLIKQLEEPKSNENTPVLLQTKLDMV